MYIIKDIILVIIELMVLTVIDFILYNYITVVFDLYNT